MHLSIINLTGGGLSGGYRKYLQNLLPLLIELPDLSALDVFVPPESKKSLSLDSFPLHSWPVSDYRNTFRWLKAKIRELSPDVVFIPNSRWIDCGGPPVTMMIRNMEPLTVPFAGNPMLEKVRNFFRAYIAKRACRNANRVIAVSQHVRNVVCNRWKIDSLKIGVVYHGIDVSKDKKIIAAPKSIRIQDGKPFVFTAGSIRPARGLEDLIRAFSRLKTTDIDCHLVIAGAIDPGMQNYKIKLEKLASESGINSQIIWAGPLNYDEMSWCYQKCSVFVMTSRAEACPNIALEAMAHGCVCIAAKNSCLPEIFRDAAIYYPPQDSGDLDSAVKTVLNLNDSKRAVISEQARKRAAFFSWDVCAQKTVAELVKAANTWKEVVDT